MRPIVSFMAGLFFGILVSIPLSKEIVRRVADKMEILYPTSTCRTDVNQYLSTHANQGHAVSGTLSDRSGYTYAHTWIEDGPRVISWGILHNKPVEFRMAKEDYYDVFGVPHD